MESPAEALGPATRWDHSVKEISISSKAQRFPRYWHKWLMPVILATQEAKEIKRTGSL
jgi:hypothetical protein